MESLLTFFDSILELKQRLHFAIYVDSVTIPRLICSSLLVSHW